MRQLLTRLILDDHGQDLIEYSFLAIFIALAVIVGLEALSAGVNSQFSNIGSQVLTGS